MLILLVLFVMLVGVTASYLLRGSNVSASSVNSH